MVTRFARTIIILLNEKLELRWKLQLNNLSQIESGEGEALPYLFSLLYSLFTNSTYSFRNREEEEECRGGDRLVEVDDRLDSVAENAADEYERQRILERFFDGSECTAAEQSEIGGKSENTLCDQIVEVFVVDTVGRRVAEA